MTEKNALCSEANGIAVYDLDTCKLAVNVIKKYVPTAIFYKEETVTYYPKGCYLSNGILVVFNKHSSGSRHENTQQICQIKGKK